MNPQTSQITFKTDIGNVSFNESHYLVRWSFRYSFAWKMKSQASQLTYKNDFINSFFLPSAEEALTDIYDQDKKINRLLD